MRTQRSKFNRCAFRKARNDRAISFGLLCIGASDAAPHTSYGPVSVRRLIFTLTVRPNVGAGEPRARALRSALISALGDQRTSRTVNAMSARSLMPDIDQVTLNVCQVLCLYYAWPLEMSVPQGIDPGELPKNRCEAFRNSHALRREHGRLEGTWYNPPIAGHFETSMRLDRYRYRMDPLGVVMNKSEAEMSAIDGEISGPQTSQELLAA
jgi:hypothetical protein